LPAEEQAEERPPVKENTRRKALEGGAEALLTKPIDFATLRTEIDGRVASAA